MAKHMSVAVLALAMTTGAAFAEAPFSAALIRDESATISHAFGTSNERFHAGVDIAAAAGTSVHAPADGRILRVHAPGELEGYSAQVVEIDHGEAGKTRISALEGVTLAPGDSVHAGDEIGRIAPGGEDTHVHVELWRGGRLYDPAHVLALTSPH